MRACASDAGQQRGMRMLYVGVVARPAGCMRRSPCRAAAQYKCAGALLVSSLVHWHRS